MDRRLVSLGLDFGTESARAVVVDLSSGEELATAVAQYPHGVITEELPESGVKLGDEWAVRHPGDWLHALAHIVPHAIREARVEAEQVVGIGVDFTSCTVLPTTANGTPPCLTEAFAVQPHAWPKLWKHHAAQPEADEINHLAAQRGESFLARYGGKIASEWLFPKALQMLREAPEVYQAASRIIEGGDWLVWYLTGEEKRSACQAGYKALWDKQAGYPSPDFFAALDSRFRDVVADKLSTSIYPVGTRAEVAQRLGLRAGTPVGVAIIDAHSAVLGTGVAEPGKMVLVLGTSTCHMVLGPKVTATGIAGIVEDGIVPGYVGYESGQAAVGDIFAWYVRQHLPVELHEEATRNGLDPYKVLEQRAARLRPGQSGLLALDWWNGNRSILMDAELSGLIVGFTLASKPEEVYRALVEATAFGTKKIVDNHEEQGIPVQELYACGGIADKSPMLMQIYADVTGREIRLAASAQATALGAAIIGAIAAGRAAGGFDDFAEATRRMAKQKETVYRPVPAHHAIYAQLYAEYVRLHDYFGRGVNDTMKVLRRLRAAASRGE
ncbi:MAG: ribulokinase [bacterium]|jgi:L-ribulokinase|nr:ribulokinase [candidate division KSB1 bacterium]MDH7561260.1 ribulokinase [bacterium]